MKNGKSQILPPRSGGARRLRRFTVANKADFEQSKAPFDLRTEAG
jgi:hypothetical protein